MCLADYKPIPSNEKEYSLSYCVQLIIRLAHSGSLSSKIQLSGPTGVCIQPNGIAARATARILC